MSPTSTSTVTAVRNPMPGMAPVNDVCVALQCGRTFVYGLLQKGALRAIKLGRLQAPGSWIGIQN